MSGTITPNHALPKEVAEVLGVLEILGQLLGHNGKSAIHKKGSHSYRLHYSNRSEIIKPSPIHAELQRNL